MTGYIYDAGGTRVVAKSSLTSFNCSFSANGYQTTARWELGPGCEQVAEYAVSSGAISRRKRRRFHVHQHALRQRTIRTASRAGLLQLPRRHRIPLHRQRNATPNLITTTSGPGTMRPTLPASWIPHRAPVRRIRPTFEKQEGYRAAIISAEVLAPGRVCRQCLLHGGSSMGRAL